MKHIGLNYQGRVSADVCISVAMPAKLQNTLLFPRMVLQPSHVLHLFLPRLLHIYRGVFSQWCHVGGFIKKSSKWPQNKHPPLHSHRRAKCNNPASALFRQYLSCTSERMTISFPLGFLLLPSLLSRPPSSSASLFLPSLFLFLPSFLAFSLSHFSLCVCILFYLFLC